MVDEVIGAGATDRPGRAAAAIHDGHPWVQRGADAGHGGPVLICLPYAGGGASFYGQWPARLAGRGVTVWPVLLPGREARYREPCLTDLRDLTGALVASLRTALAERPYALYGHSAGASMAYALALHAIEAGLPGPEHLFLAAQRPLDRPDPDFPIHRLPRDAFRAKVLSFGGVPPEILDYGDILDALLDTVRADLGLVERATLPVAGGLTCPVTVFGGIDDSNVPLDLLPRWRAVTSAACVVVDLPGGHFPGPAAQHRVWEVISHAFRSVDTGAGWPSGS